MDSPSSGSLAPPALSDRVAEAGETSRTTPRPPAGSREDVVLIAGLGNPVAADYAAYVGRSSRGHALLVADEETRAPVEPPARSLAPDESWRPPSDVRGELGPASSLILFIPPRLTEEDRRKAA